MALREYVDQTIERIDADDVLRSDGAYGERRSWRRPATAVAVAALAMIVVVVTTVVVIETIREDPEAPVSPSSTTTTAVSTTTVESSTSSSTATTVPLAPPVTWNRAVVESPENASIAGVAAADGFLVAVGERTTVASQDEYPSDAAVWVSTDGVTWTAIDDPSFNGRNGDETDGLGLYDRSQAMWDVAAGPLGVIAIGRDEASGAMWISQDAETWTRVADERLSVIPVPLWRIIAGGPGWVAVGEDGQGNGWVWLSGDGVGWTVVTDDAFSFDQYNAPVALYDVVVHGDRLVVAGSIGYADTPDARDAIWVSDDGLTWELAVSGEVPSLALSRDRNRGTLIGFTDTPLLSSDAITWTPGAAPSPPPTASVTFHDTWALAAGIDLAASVWISDDGGRTWTKTLPDTPEFSADSWTVDSAPLGDDVVVVGTRPGILAKAAWGNAADSTAEIWIARWDGP